MGIDANRWGVVPFLRTSCLPFFQLKGGEMKLRSAIAFVVSLALICPSTGFAEGPKAVGRLAAEGKAQVNNVTAPAGTTIFDGDMVSVAGQGLATVWLGGGSRVLVTENSTAQMLREEQQTIVKIAQGTVAVMNDSEGGVVVNAQGLLIRTLAGTPARFAARIEKRAVVLTSVAGSVSVEGATSKHVVPEGKSMRFELESDYPQGPAGVGAGGATSVVLTALIVTAIIAAIVIPVVLHNTGDPVSP